MARLHLGLTLVAGVLGCIGPACAAVLPIIGVYGNEAGCQAYFSGNIDNDQYLYLTPDTFSSYGSGCDFAELVSSHDGVSVVSGVCFAEGEQASQTDTIVITGTAEGGFYVALDGLDPLGPLGLCPEKTTEALI